MAADSERLVGVEEPGEIGSPEEIFERVTRLVCRMLDVPVALLSQVDSSGQYFTSAQGLTGPWMNLEKLPLSHSICLHVLRLGAPLAVADARNEIFLQGNPAVSELNIQAYLGVPVRDAEGRVVASLCAIDHKRREWREKDIAVMTDLAEIVESRLRFHNRSRLHAERERRSDETRFRSITDTAPAMIWETDSRGSSIYRSRGWQTFTGQTPAEALGFGWLDAVHSEDRAGARQAILDAILAQRPFRIGYRLCRADGCWRQIVDAGNPHFGDDGRFLGFVGLAYDDTERHEADEARDFVGRELSHRIKNIFAMVSGLVGLSSRDHAGTEDFALALRDRIAALARAHEFALPKDGAHGSAEPRTHTMTALLQTLFTPYRMEGKGARIVIAADDFAVDAAAAITLAMLLHELTTNAVKYGALSNEAGLVQLRGTVDGAHYVLLWEESGGPEVSGPPAKHGFGTTMVERAANLQLGATFDYQWKREGLRLLLSIPIANVCK